MSTDASAARPVRRIPRSIGCRHLMSRSSRLYCGEAVMVLGCQLVLEAQREACHLPLPPGLAVSSGSADSFEFSLCLKLMLFISPAATRSRCRCSSAPRLHIRLADLRSLSSAVFKCPPASFHSVSVFILQQLPRDLRSLCLKTFSQHAAIDPGVF